MDLVDSLTFALAKLGINPQEANTYAYLLQQAGLVQIEDLRRRFKVFAHRYLLLTFVKLQ